uniref:RH35585p n=1 Tax=Drosophila melanogaster TaxID=7227 RepID=Q8IGF1_DROME|nr:RH35585p [Drosophila melanogaster]
MFKSPDQTHHRELHIQMHSHILVLIELAGVLGDAYLNHSRGKAFALNPEHIDRLSLALIAIAARQGA